MTARFETSEKDLGTRRGHWLRSLEAKPSDIVSALFGAGSGTFPRLFFFYEAQNRTANKPRDRPDQAPNESQGFYDHLASAPGKIADWPGDGDNWRQHQ